MHPDKDFNGIDCTSVFSRIWKKIFKKDPPWKRECVKHHIHYWVGGSCRDRLLADLLLYKGICNTGHSIIALMIFITARMDGSPEWGSGYEYRKSLYFDRHHDLFVILEEKCKELGFAPSEIFGVKP